MLIPSMHAPDEAAQASLSRRVNANSQRFASKSIHSFKLIKKGEC